MLQEVNFADISESSINWKREVYTTDIYYVAQYKVYDMKTGLLEVGPREVNLWYYVHMNTKSTLLTILSTCLLTLGAVVTLYAAYEYRQRSIMFSPVGEGVVIEETVGELRDRCFNMVQTDPGLNAMVFPQEATDSAEMASPTATSSSPLRR